ncbi:hypothetical protein M231_03533 [Tremella mesenterica]|uniref:Zn(2)-C6 fungal-type domain-containing protein n=1 Tax=Tremella mesenterica TaxID=5217 RepID=A0A4Q1BMX7_TREME|nr:hypothetical protein M231_03533 [Tremella mesenterica]
MSTHTTPSSGQTSRSNLDSSFTSHHDTSGHSTDTPISADSANRPFSPFTPRQLFPIATPRRNRCPMACTHCRRRKIKCQGGQPRCDACVRRGGTCIYASVPKDDSPETREKNSAARLARQARKSRTQPSTPNPSTQHNSPISLSTTSFRETHLPDTPFQGPFNSFDIGLATVSSNSTSNSGFSTPFDSPRSVAPPSLPMFSGRSDYPSLSNNPIVSNVGFSGSSPLSGIQGSGLLDQNRSRTFMARMHGHRKNLSCPPPTLLWARPTPGPLSTPQPENSTIIPPGQFLPVPSYSSLTDNHINRQQYIQHQMTSHQSTSEWSNSLPYLNMSSFNLSHNNPNDMVSLQQESETFEMNHLTLGPAIHSMSNEGISNREFNMERSYTPTQTSSYHSDSHQGHLTPISIPDRSQTDTPYHTPIEQTPYFPTSEGGGWYDPDTSFQSQPFTSQNHLNPHQTHASNFTMRQDNHMIPQVDQGHMSAPETPALSTPTSTSNSGSYLDENNVLEWGMRHGNKGLGIQVPTWNQREVQMDEFRYNGYPHASV